MNPYHDPKTGEFTHGPGGAGGAGMPSGGSLRPVAPRAPRSTNLDRTLADLPAGHSTKPQTHGKVSTWFEKSGDGKEVRLIRETQTPKGSVSEVAKRIPSASLPQRAPAPKAAAPRDPFGGRIHPALAGIDTKLMKVPARPADFGLPGKGQVRRSLGTPPTRALPGVTYGRSSGLPAGAMRGGSGVILYR